MDIPDDEINRILDDPDNRAEFRRVKKEGLRGGRFVFEKETGKIRWEKCVITEPIRNFGAFRVVRNGQISEIDLGGSR
jgi:hypothetical protein